MVSQRVRHDLVTETTIKLNGKSRENCLKRNFTLFNVYIVLKKKKQRHYFANKGPSSQGYGFSSSHVWI